VHELFTLGNPNAQSSINEKSTFNRNSTGHTGHNAHKNSASALFSFYRMHHNSDENQQQLPKRCTRAAGGLPNGCPAAAPNCTCKTAPGRTAVRGLAGGLPKGCPYDVTMGSPFYML